MNFNWGHKIALTFIAFAAMMIFMVVKSFRQNIDLVTDDYYAEELAYQGQIDRTQNAVELGNPFASRLSNQGVEVRFINQELAEKVHGTVHLYRPSNAAFDKQYNIQFTEGNTQLIPLHDLTVGRYLLKISYSIDSVAYYQELEINVPG